jgi:hypothetical protein
LLFKADEGLLGVLPEDGDHLGYYGIEPYSCCVAAARKAAVLYT